MDRCADAGRRHVDLAWIGFGVSDELRDCLSRNGWIDHHDIGYAHDARNRRDVADEIEIEFFIKRRVDRGRRRDKEKRVTIRRRIHDGLGGDVRACTWPVLDDEWLAKLLRQPLPHQTRDDVVASAGGKPNDPAHRPRRIIERRCNARQDRERGSARCQTQNSSAGKFHSITLQARTMANVIMPHTACPRPTSWWRKRDTRAGMGIIDFQWCFARRSYSVLTTFLP